MIPSPRISTELLDRYFTGQCTPDEIAAVQAAIADNPTLGALARGMTSKPVDVRGAWARFEQIHMQAAVARQGAGARVVSANSTVDRATRRLGVGIAALAAAGAAVFMVTSGNRATSPEAPTTSPRTYTTAAGQHATVRLQDGSSAILGPATTLRVVSAKGGAGTVVSVSGQALFSVAHHANAPFAVQAGSSVTRVLGTTFLVRRYNTDAMTRIVVSDGRVAVQGDHNKTNNMSHVLNARELATVDDSGQVRIVPNIAVDDYTAWTNGVLVFRDSRLRDVVADLERAYGVDIQLADSTLAQQRITWTVSVNRQSLVDVLNELPLLVDVHVLRSDSVVTLAPGRRALRRQQLPVHPFTPESRYGR